jgi:hypothetical protein
MKSVAFQWAWGDHEPCPDHSMTRERAARLIRAWRNAKTQGRREFTLRVYRRGLARCYAVRTTKYINDDEGVLVIAPAAV